MSGTVNVGAPGLGNLPYYSFEDFALWDDTTASVNVANGNLVVGANDSLVNGPGLGSRVDRFYNGLGSVDGSFGGGWILGVGQDVGLSITSSAITLKGSNGFQSVFTSNGSGGWNTPSGLNATLTKSSTEYTLIYNRTGEKLTFALGGFLIKDADRNGTGLSFAYTSNKITTITDAAARTNTFTYTGAFIDKLTDAGSRETTYTRDSSNRLSTVTAPDGGVATYTYDTTGRLSTITGPTGAGKTTFTYDTSHRVKTVAQTVTSDTWGAKANRVTTFTYNAGSTVVNNANGKNATYSYDAEGKVTGTKDQLNRERATEWSTNFDVSKTTDSLASGTTPGNSTTYAYDSLNNATQISLPTGAAASAQYALGAGCSSSSGNQYQPKCATDAAGNSKTMQYDPAGNLLSRTDTTAGGSGAVTQKYTYDNSTGTVCGGKAGQVCTSTDGNNKVTSYAYNSKGELLTATPPAPLGTTTYTYDSLSRVRTVKDGRGTTLTYQYGVDDRIQVTLNRTSTTLTQNSQEWSKAGYLTYSNDRSDVPNLTNPSQTYTTTRPTFYDTDTIGRQVEVDYWSQVTNVLQTTDPGGASAAVAGGTPASPVSEWRATFDYDAVGNLVTYSDPNGNTTYTYDSANQLTKVKEPGGTCPTTGAPATNSGCTTFTYDANGRELTRVFPGNTTQSTAYDTSGRPTRITTKTAANAVLMDIGYSFQQPGITGTAGDRAAIQSRTSYKEEGITAGAISTYSYDSLLHLRKAEEKIGASTTASWQYAYDNAGNRTNQIRSGGTGATAGTINYAYNDANQLTSATGSTTTWTYDAAGNQTTNGLTGQSTTFSIFGQQQKVGATTMKYRSTGNSNLTFIGTSPVRTTPLGVAVSTSRNYTRTPDGSVLSFRDANGSTYFSKDALGSVVGLISSSGSWVGGYSYSPYGEARATTNNTATTSNPVRYIGLQQVDSSGIYKVGARYYDPSLGRFTQVDPSGQESNPYLYSGADPINRSDPSGLFSAAVIIQIIDILMWGGDIYSLFNADSDAAGISAEFAIGCGWLAGAIAAPTTAGIIVAIGGCFVAGLLLDSALEEQGIE
ncbi:RHS repeat-associated protein [Rathayibacter sp. PhB185]|nr:RHS repeat-associated protein [Rathayibacter sp. PhB186]ROS46939.1 RHS repeat-associated protein [Rathayibacter sp. PhB185]